MLFKKIDYWKYYFVNIYNNHKSEYLKAVSHSIVAMFNFLFIFYNIPIAAKTFAPAEYPT